MRVTTNYLSYRCNCCCYYYHYLSYRYNCNCYYYLSYRSPTAATAARRD